MLLESNRLEIAANLCYSHGIIPFNFSQKNRVIFFYSAAMLKKTCYNCRKNFLRAFIEALEASQLLERFFLLYYTCQKQSMCFKKIISYFIIYFRKLCWNVLTAVSKKLSTNLSHDFFLQVHSIFPRLSILTPIQSNFIIIAMLHNESLSLRYYRHEVPFKQCNNGIFIIYLFRFFSYILPIVMTN